MSCECVQENLDAGKPGFSQTYDADLETCTEARLLDSDDLSRRTECITANATGPRRVRLGGKRRRVVGSGLRPGEAALQVAVLGWATWAVWATCTRTSTKKVRMPLK